MTNDPRAVLTRPAPPPDLTVRYGEHPEHVIDVRVPPAGSAPRRLVVFIHGGFWRAAYDRHHCGPLAADLAARGWPVATIEFRRVGQEGGGWPGTFDDVATAVRAAPRLIADAGRPDLVTGAPIVAGHSAGGHLALWCARAAPDTAAGALALAPVCDLRTAYDRGLGDGAVAELLGGGPTQVPDRYAAADPMAHPRPDAPTVLVHGTDDDRVPVDLSRGYAAQTGARLVELPGVEHFGVIDPESAAWPAVLGALSEIDQVLTSDLSNR